MALPFENTPKLRPSETDKFLEKMSKAQRGTAQFNETPKLKDAEHIIRKQGVTWKEETK